MTANTEHKERKGTLNISKRRASNINRNDMVTEPPNSAEQPINLELKTGGFPAI